jgi:hypothetical protein
MLTGEQRDGASMAKVDDAAILRRAKELCAQDRTTWDWARDNKPTADQAGRRKYLTLAREQLLQESGGA